MKLVTFGLHMDLPDGTAAARLDAVLMTDDHNGAHLWADGTESAAAAFVALGKYLAEDPAAPAAVRSLGAKVWAALGPDVPTDPGRVA